MYTWSDKETDVIWRNDEFQTIEECVEDAKHSGKEIGDVIAVGACYPYIPSPDISEMLEQIEYDAYEFCGEVAEDWRIGNRRSHEKEYDELQEKVTVLVNEYLDKIGEKPSFYKVDDIKTVEIK